MNRLEKGKEHMAELGRQGGLAKVPKGFAMLDPAERSRRAKAAVKARWGTPASRPKTRNSGRLSDAGKTQVVAKTSRK